MVDPESLPTGRQAGLDPESELGFWQSASWRNAPAPMLDQEDKHSDSNGQDAEQK